MNTEYQLDYREEPLLILPLSVGALLLSGEFFRWFEAAAKLPADGVAAFRIVYWVAFLCCSGLAAYRLIRTIHATANGLELRTLGNVWQVIPWSEFHCAVKGRPYGAKRDSIFLIPRSCDEPPADRVALHRYLAKNYAECTEIAPTKNNQNAIGAFLGVKHL